MAIRCSSLLLAALLFVSFGIKLAVGHDGDADSTRLAHDIGLRFDMRGFKPVRTPSALWMTAQVRGDCRIAVGSGDDGGATIDQFRMEATPAQVLTGYRGHWSARIIGPRAALERQVQNRAFALGLVLSRDAVLNVASTGHCPAPGLLFDGLRIWPRTRIEQHKRTASDPNQT